MEYHFTTPISEADVRRLRSGDIVYISGKMVTSRDDGHKRLAKDNIMPETDLDGMALYHAGPIVRKQADGTYELLSCGPTTSMRMEKYEADFIKKSGVKIIIGKGGMGPSTAKACADFGAVHCVFPGGCAVVAAGGVEKITGVEWEDFGMPEAMWIFKVNEFGPVIVNIDTIGGNLIDDNKKLFEERKAAELKKCAERLNAEE